MDDKLYKKIVKRMEEDKIPVYPGIIRKKALVRYKGEKEAELKRRQKEYESKIEKERRRRAEAERKRYEQWQKHQEVVKAARAGHWVRVNPDGSVSGAGEAAYSPSQAEAMGYKWGTTTTKNGKTVFVPLPKAPTEAEYLGVLEWKVREGHYKKPEVERQIKQEIELGGKKYGITAPAWAGGYLKQYSAAAREIRGAYQKAVESLKTPSGYELKEITLGKKGLRFGYVSKLPPLREPPTKKIPDEQVIPKRDEPKYKEVPKGFVRPTPYAPKFGVVEGMPTISLQPKKLRHPAYMMGTVTATPEVHKPGVVSTFLGIPARKQKKVVEKELKDVITIESEYEKKGWIKPVLPTLKPEDIGKIEIVGEYKDKGFARPTPQLEMQFVGSPEYQVQLEKVKKIDVGIKPYVREGIYTSPTIMEFEKKWKPYTKGEFFSGTKEQHAQYLKEGGTASEKQKADIAAFHTEIDVLKGLEGKQEERYKALTKEYGEYEVAAKEYKRLHGLSLMGKYKRGEEKAGRWVAARTPDIQKHLAYAEKPEVKKEIEETYGEYRGLFGLPQKPFEWEKKLEKTTSEFKVGIYEGMREKPLKTAVTTAAFFALPTALKGVRMAAKPAVVAGTKVFPRAMPWAAKWTPRAIGVGLGGIYGYSIEERIRAAPPEKRVREFGKITGTELLPMAVGTYAGMKAIPSIVRGAEVTPEGAIRTYKGLGLGEYKRPVVGMFRETTKTPDIAVTQKALVLGREYPLLRSLKGTERLKFETPWLGKGAGGWRTTTYKELGLGRGIKYEAKKGDILWGRDVFIGKVKKPPVIPERLGIPETTTRDITLWKRGKDVSLARRPTSLVPYEEPPISVIKPRGIRIEKRDIPTITELEAGRLYRAELGYKAFQIGKYPSITKILGLAKPKKPSFGTTIIHPPKGVGGVVPVSKLGYKPLGRLSPVMERYIKDIRVKMGVSVIEEPKFVGIKEQWDIPIGEGIPSWKGWIPKKGIKRKVDVWFKTEGEKVVKPIDELKITPESVFKLDLSKPQKPYRIVQIGGIKTRVPRKKVSEIKTIQEKEAEIKAKIESGEYIAHKDAKGMITLQKVVTKQKVKPIVKEVTTVAEKAQKDLAKLISGERPKYKVKQKTIFKEFEVLRTKIPLRTEAVVKPQPKHRVFPAFYPFYDSKEKEKAKISEKYEYEPLTFLGQRFKHFQSVALKHDVKLKEKTRLAFVPFAGQAYKHEPIVEQKVKPIEKFVFKEANILDRIFETPPVPSIPPRQPFKLPTPPYIKPKKDKKLKPRRRPFGAYQLDVTNPILSPVDLLRMMGGFK